MVPPFRRACVAACVLISVSAQGQEAPTLELAAYVRAVLEANPTIEAARSAERAARARVRRAGAFEDPMIELGAAPLSFASSHGPIGYELGISQKLPWFGTRAAERDVVRAEAHAAALDIEHARRELALAAVSLYARYCLSLDAIQLNQQHIELVRSLQKSATAQLEAGRGTLQDSLSADSELAALERDALSLSAERDVVIAQMNELLHREPATPLAAPAGLPAFAATADTTAALAREALNARTEIAAARLRARAEAAKERAAERDYYPSFTLSTSYSSMWDMPQHRWMIGASLSVPLPTDRRAAAIDEARAARTQHEREAERLIDTTRTEVFVAVRKLQESQQLLQLYEQRLLPLARERVAAAQASFSTATTPFAAAIEAEKQLRSLELERTAARTEQLRRSAELEYALGRIPGLSRLESP
jgi:outer membrane protein, heavy metal efflux system